MSLRKAIVLAVVLSACAPTADPPPSDSSPLQGGTPLPCDVAKVLHDKCWTCHGTTLENTAPMHLTSWESTQAPTQDHSMPVYKRIHDRIHNQANPMPPFSWPTRLIGSEVDVLDRWVANGGPPGDGNSAACQPAPPPGSGGATGAGGNGGGGTNGGGAGGDLPGTGGGSVTPPPLPDGGTLVTPVEDIPVRPDPSECTMIPVHARQDASGAPYTVPSGEQYYCFSFKLPFNGKPVQALSFSPHHDSTTVIHHWLLYKMVTPQIDGLVLPCVGFHADGALLAGWALGGGDWYLPKDVGVNLGGGDFILEIHYNNTGAPVPDTSGVDICSTTTLRPKTAGVFWLGTANITIPAGSQDTELTHNCKPQLTNDFHILRSWPHMHRLGRHMHAEVHHADGSINPIFNVPFDFNSQVQYDTPYIVKQGDYISTTCGYQNDTGSDVSFGESTSSEMCFNFTIGYPDTANLPGGLTPAACDN